MASTLLRNVTNLMKVRQLLSLILLSLGFAACGSGLDTYHSAGLQQAGLVDGVLTIPLAGTLSGRSYLNTENSGFYIDLQESDPEAIDYLNRLGAGQISVSRTEISTGTLYSVRFSGTFGSGPCPFQPSSTCSLIQLRALVAY
jgi:hypothetical protein